MIRRPSPQRGHRLWWCAAALLLIAPGCRTADPLPGIAESRAVEPLPTHEWVGPGHAVGVLAERARGLEGVAARCTLTVETPDRGPVSLDGLLVAQKPDRLRMQAWKFDQPVFDLVLDGEAMWLWTRGEAADAEAHLPDTADTGLWLNPLLDPLDPAAMRVVEDNPATGRLTVSWPLAALRDGPAGEAAEGWSLLVEIDRPTLTIREMRVLDPDRQTVQTLRLEGYGLVQGVPWPMRLTASGAFDMRLRIEGVELNPDLPPTAFVPRRGAVRR